MERRLDDLRERVLPDADRVIRRHLRRDLRAAGRTAEPLSDAATRRVTTRLRSTRSRTNARPSIAVRRVERVVELLRSEFPLAVFLESGVLVDATDPRRRHAVGRTTHLEQAHAS